MKSTVDKNNIPLMEDFPELKSYTQPKPVGYWVLGAGNGAWTQFAMFSKPTDVQIKNHYEILGWEWRDVEVVYEQT